MRSALRVVGLVGLIVGILAWRRTTTPARLVVLPPWDGPEWP